MYSQETPQHKLERRFFTSGGEHQTNQDLKIIDFDNTSGEEAESDLTETLQKREQRKLNEFEAQNLAQGKQHIAY